jgi:hypothetical protein
MRKIDTSIQQAQRELTQWVEFLSTVDMPVSGSINLHQVVGNDDVNGVRLGYALMRFTECWTQLERLESVRNRVYGNRELTLTEDVLAVSQWASYLEKMGLGLDLWFEIELKLNSYIDESTYFGVQEGHIAIEAPHNWDDSFDHMLDSLIEKFQLLKEAAMTADGLRGIGDEDSIWTKQVDFLREKFDLTMRQLSMSEHHFALQRHYQHCLREEHIYSWLPNASKEGGSYMRFLIDPIMMRIDGEKEMIRNAIRQKFPDSQGTEYAIGLIERLQEGLIHYGDYDSLSQEILEGMDMDSRLASGNPDSLLGSHGGCNVIPSRDQNGHCQNLVVALARGKGRDERSFKNVLRELRRHLIDCKGTQVAVLLSDRWAPDEFEESRMDIEGHMRQGMIFIPILVSGTSLSIFSL